MGPIFQQRLSEFIVMLLTGLLALGLLAYVGEREAYTKYPQFEIDKVVAQAQPIQQTLEKFLNAGLPLSQFAGFDTLVGPIIKGDDAIDAITIISATGAVVFQQVDPRVEIDQIEKVDRSLDHNINIPGATQTQIFIPLRSRFGFSGQLVIHLPNKYVSDKIKGATRLLPWAAALGAILFGVYGGVVVNSSPAWRARWDQVVFTLMFLSVAGSVIYGLTNLYIDGSQVKAEGFANVLREKVKTIFDLGLSLTDIDGIDRILRDYDELSPDIENVSLVINNQVIASSVPEMVGKPVAIQRFAFHVLSPIAAPDGVDAKISLFMPYSVVMMATARTAKTFIVLLVASAFMAGLFFQLGGALRRLKDARSKNATDGQSAVDAIKPVLFVGFLIENLAASFLPQLMQKSAAAAGLSPTLGSLMFMAYFVTFALTLVPAGIFAGERGARPLILLGAVLAAAAAALMAISNGVLAIVAARMLSGVGQGMLFIGSQSYILAYAAADKRTQSAGIIVYTFNGGMLSGLVIGGLLSNYLGTSGVFWIAAASAMAIFLYTWALIENSPIDAKVTETTTRVPRRSIFGVFRSVGFLWTTVLVGIPAKAVLTGVIFFAMPLLLTGQNLAQDDIGQIIMFYALGVLVSSHFISRFADRGGNLRWILFSGLSLSGIGLCVIGAVGWQPIIALGLGPITLTILLLVGTFAVGVGHGCINAPVVTHIASSDASRQLGEAQVTAFYRFIERGGHIAGPILVGQLFLLSKQSPTAIGWLGVAMMVLAVVFVLYRPKQIPGDPG